MSVNFDANTGAQLEELGATLSRLEVVGFSHAELSSKKLGVVVGGGVHPARLAALRAVLDGCSLRLCLHAAFSSVGRVGNLMDAGTPAQLAVAKADLRLATEIGAEVIVFHSGMMRDSQANDDALASGMKAEREALRALGDEGGRLGVRVAVENENPRAFYLARRAYGIALERLADQISAVDHPQVGVCLDTGHAFLAAAYGGLEFIDTVRDTAPLVNHVHLSDNMGRVELASDGDPNESLATGDGDLHLPPGWGRLPLRQLFEVPFVRNPVVILEMRPAFAAHFPEILASTRKLLALAAEPLGGSADDSSVLRET